VLWKTLSLCYIRHFQLLLISRTDHPVTSAKLNHSFCCLGLDYCVLMQEDEMLRRLVAQHGTKKWAHLATIIKSKKSKQVSCCTVTRHFPIVCSSIGMHRDLIQPSIHAYTPRNLVMQCRRRWKNFQDAELKKTGVWTPAVCSLTAFKPKPGTSN